MGSSEKKLFLIPCCSTKYCCGDSSISTPEPLTDLVLEKAHSAILETRKQVLSDVRQDKRYLFGKYEKNGSLETEPDLGGQRASGLYLSAVQRYKGILYSNAPTLSSRSNWNGQILILSALYRPLHPLSRIQNYNLQMSDSPAYRAWKKRLPQFLRNYALSNDIQEIHLFFGSSTHYLKVAKAKCGPNNKNKYAQFTGSLKHCLDSTGAKTELEVTFKLDHQVENSN